MRLLRGLPVENISAAADGPRESKKHDREPDRGGHRKRRRLAGEDETEREIRCAREDQELVTQRAEAAPLRKPKNVPLTGLDGHINLFAGEATRQEKTVNPEAAAEAAKKKREFEDQYTMRFSNAAGFQQDVGERPWYSTEVGRVKNADDAPSKNVWGNDDPRRKDRDKKRLAADDPMATIKRGVQGVRQVEKERQEWKRERQRELDDLAREEKRKRRERRRVHKHDDSDLEDFRLDGDADSHSKDLKPHDRHRARGRKDHEGRTRYKRHHRESERVSSRHHDHRATDRSVGFI